MGPPPIPREATAHTRRLLLAGTAASAAAAWMLLRFPPSLYSFYPECPFHALCGLRCPGCGATRALAALLRGDLRYAFAQNALLVAALPAAVLWLADAAWHGRLRQPGRGAVWAGVLAATVFAVWRNLP